MRFHKLVTHCNDCGAEPEFYLECGPEFVHSPPCLQCKSDDTAIEKLSSTAVFPFSKQEPQNVH